MDPKTMRKLREISQKVTRDVKKHGIKTESAGKEVYERLDSARKEAKTLKGKEQVSRILGSDQMQQMKDKKLEEINHDYGQEVDRRMTKEIDRAVKRGDIKLDRSGYDNFMRRNHKK